jgi:hypothetical protein
VPIVLPLLLAGLLLALPAATGAKFPCEGGGKHPRGFTLRGLPDNPVPGRSYELSVMLEERQGVNRSPYLGAEYCGDKPSRGVLAGAGGWFEHAEGGAYVLSLRFPEPGRWAVSFMDLDGTFYDLGVRRVAARSPAISGRSAPSRARAARAGRCGRAATGRR